MESAAFHISVFSQLLKIAALQRDWCHPWTWSVIELIVQGRLLLVVSAALEQLH